MDSMSNNIKKIEEEKPLEEGFDEEHGNGWKALTVANDGVLANNNANGDANGVSSVNPAKMEAEEDGKKDDDPKPRPRRRRVHQISAPVGLFGIQSGPIASADAAEVGTGTINAADQHTGEGLPEPRRRPRRVKQLSEPTSIFATAGIEKREWKPVHHQLRAQEMKDTQFGFGIPTQAAAEVHVEEKHGKDSWRYIVVRWLHSKLVTHTMMALLVLDVIILFIEIFLLALYPPCIITERDAISCFPKDYNTNVTDNVTDPQNPNRFLAGGGDGEICSDGLEPNYEYPAGCDDNKWETVHKAEGVLFALTMTILSTFMFELNVEMIALGPKVFFRQIFFFLDYFVIAVSLILEAYFHSINQDDLQSLVGMLVLIRIWRFIRIGHGIVAVTAEMSDTKYESLLAHVEHLEEIIRQNNIDTPAVATKVSELERATTDVLDQVKKEHRLHLMHKKSKHNLTFSDDDDDNAAAAAKHSE